MFVTWEEIQIHPTTSLFMRVSEQKKQRLLEEEARAGAKTEFWAYDQPLVMVNLFFYLGWILNETDYDFPSVIGKTRKSGQI